MSGSASSSLSSPTSSLLQMNRPAHLPPQSTSQTKSRSGSDSSDIVRTTSQRPSKRIAVQPITPAQPLESTKEGNAVASTSRGPAYLNVDAVVSSFHDHALADIIPRITSTACCDDSSSALAAFQEGACGEVVPKEQWQPDSSSAFCSYPFCTAQFPSTEKKYASYFSLAPRRHHCRKCGQLFCGDHSAQRAPLSHVHQGKRVVSQERVCDVCIPRPEQVPAAQRSRRSSAWSENTQSTGPSDTLVTPDSDDSAYIVSSIILSQTASISRTSTRGNLEISVEPIEELAPIEPWMGPAGILSLYPLAVHPSHASKTERPTPAAGPLFGPSLEARRTAKEKELQRMSLRQRRMGNDNSFWIPGTWGYRREDFDPTFHDEDVEGEVQTEGGLVVDGPIRFRSGAKKVTTPSRTPSEERSRMDWSPANSGFARI